ncbi:WD40-repeat-containing domain protein, partial [Dunaliella salina]
EVVKVIEEAHESEIVSLAYNRVRKEIYSCADGDKVIKVWDCRNGQLIRTQQGHKGMVTCLYFAATVKLLFSGSIDNTVGIWTEKGINLQMTSVGGPVFSIAWDDRRRFLIAGGQSIISIFKVDLSEVRKLSQQQRSVASGLKDGASAGSSISTGDVPQVLKRAHAPFKGPDLCHADVVKCIVVTETGKIMSGGYDKSICIYEFDKLEKPREAVQRIRKCHTAAIVSMAYDSSNNCILTGAIDGSMKVWSMEGRLLDKFENINDQPVCVAYVPPINMYWASGRFGRLLAYDPRAPLNVTEFVKDANSLDKFKVSHMFAPPHTDLLLGATRQRQLVIWQHSRNAAYRMFREHSDWVEALVVVQTTLHEKPVEEIFSAGADGKLLRWQLDAEQNCDIYECIEEIPLHKRNIYAIVFHQEQNCLITGGEDTTIQLYYLSGEVPTFNDVPLPTSFTDHEARVTGLAMLKNHMLASISFDRTIRIWDLSNMKPVSVVYNAHDTPIQCIEYAQERGEIATCGMGNKVKVWDVRKPTSVRLKLVLNHADMGQADSDDEQGEGAGKPNSMTWLTRSDLTGLPPSSASMNPMVEEAIRKANRDVPEVTQVRWASFRNCWVTAADDDMIRLWSVEGIKLHQFSYSGGSVQCLYVDEKHKLLVASMLDKHACVYDLDDPIPRATFKGHSDVVRAISYLESCDCYITASWDMSLRLWFRPTNTKAGTTDRAATAGKDGGIGLLDEEEDEEAFVSNYEKQHPLEVPRALTEANQWQLLKAIGVLEDDKTTTGRKGRQRALKAETDFAAAEEFGNVDPPGSLGAKLSNLGTELLQDINNMALQRKQAQEAAEARAAASTNGKSNGQGGNGQQHRGLGRRPSMRR